MSWNAKAEREGTRLRVFCASMADVFEDHDGLDAHRSRLFDLIRSTPNLDWQLLTKRPENVRLMVPLPWLGDWPSNAWIGTSTEDQATWNARIPVLCKIPAATRFVSVEPMLGNILMRHLENPWPSGEGADYYDPLSGMTYWADGELSGNHAKLHWIICGGESGPRARPMHPGWAMVIRDQCRAADVPFFFKQWGEWHPDPPCLLKGLRRASVCRGGEWLFEDVDQYQEKATRLQRDGLWVDATSMYRSGKKAAGRFLDGREWNEYPDVLSLSKA